MANGGGGLPRITGIDPTRGPAPGGTRVRITGSSFNGASSVTFGGVPARVFQVNSDSEILATTDATPVGDQPVVVTGPGGSASGQQLFTFIPAPVILDARVQPGSDTVLIVGTSLQDVLTVTFVQTVNPDGDPDAGPSHTVRTPAMKVNRIDDTSLLATRPPGPAGPADVVVTTPGGDSAPFSLSFPVRDSRRWIFWLSVGYLVSLLAGLVAYVHWPAFGSVLPNQIGPVPIAVPWFGALGAVTLSLYGVLWHRVDWDPTFTLWHVVRPLMGVVLGTVAYLLVAGGIVASGGAPSGTVTPTATPPASPSPSASATVSATASTTTSTATTTSTTSQSKSATGTLTVTATVTETTLSTTTSSTTTNASPGLNPNNPFNNAFYYVLAFLVGFRESTFRTLIQKLADLVAAPGGSSGSGGGSSGGGGSGSGGSTGSSGT